MGGLRAAEELGARESSVRERLDPHPRRRRGRDAGPSRPAARDRLARARRIAGSRLLSQQALLLPRPADPALRVLPELEPASLPPRPRPVRGPLGARAHGRGRARRLRRRADDPRRSSRNRPLDLQAQSIRDPRGDGDRAIPDRLQGRFARPAIEAVREHPAATALVQAAALPTAADAVALPLPLHVRLETRVSRRLRGGQLQHLHLGVRVPHLASDEGVAAIDTAPARDVGDAVRQARPARDRGRAGPERVAKPRRLPRAARSIRAGRGGRLRQHRPNAGDRPRARRRGGRLPLERQVPEEAELDAAKPRVRDGVDPLSRRGRVRHRPILRRTREDPSRHDAQRLLAQLPQLLPRARILAMERPSRSWR